MRQSDYIVSINEWRIYDFMNHYYNGAHESVITQLLSVLENSYHHAGIAPGKCWLFQQLKITEWVDEFNNVFFGS